jgi:hypothetical protein
MLKLNIRGYDTAKHNQLQLWHFVHFANDILQAVTQASSGCIGFDHKPQMLQRRCWPGTTPTTRTRCPTPPIYCGSGEQRPYLGPKFCSLSSAVFISLFIGHIHHNVPKNIFISPSGEIKKMLLTRDIAIFVLATISGVNWDERVIPAMQSWARDLPTVFILEDSLEAVIFERHVCFYFYTNKLLIC